MNSLTRSKTPVTWPQYGVTLGGPILKQRTFFFTNYERTRNSGTSLVTISPANVAAVNVVLSTRRYPGPPISTGIFPATLKTDTFFLRLDHRLSTKDQIFAYKLSQTGQLSTGSTTDRSRQTNLFTTDQVFAINNVYSVSPRTFNETRGQFFRFPLRAPGISANAPAVTISGIAAFGPAATFPTARSINGGELANAITLLRGNHSSNSALTRSTSGS